ncbi:hypothetical protein D3C80_534970 [compost metagenome]
MLGETAFLHQNLATSAGRPPAAHAFHIDPKLARSIEHRRADRKAATLAGWHEQDEGISTGCVSHSRSLTPSSRLPQPVQPYRRADHLRPMGQGLRQLHCLPQACNRDRS